MPPSNPAPSPAGSFKVFRFAGVSVYVHWSWFLVAAFEFKVRASEYTFQAWNIAEYLALFGIVLLHEFGHALGIQAISFPWGSYPIHIQTQGPA